MVEGLEDLFLIELLFKEGGREVRNFSRKKEEKLFR